MNSNDLQINTHQPEEAPTAILSFFTGVHITGKDQPKKKVPLGQVLPYWEDPENEEFIALTQRLRALKYSDEQAYKKERGKRCPTYQIGDWNTRNQCHTYVPILVFDIDGCEESSYKEYLAKCSAIPYLYHMMPSLGYGGRILVKCNSNPNTHKAYYQAICQDLSQKLGIPLKEELKGQETAKERAIPHLDTTTSDLNRLWFACHTPKELVYHNEESKVYHLPEDPTQKTATKQEQKRLQKGGYPVEFSQWDKVDNLISQIERKGEDITKGMTNNWFPKILLPLANEFGEEGRLLAHRVSRFHPDYSQAETDQQYNNALGKDNNQVRINTFYALCKNLGYLVDFDALKTKHSTSKTNSPTIVSSDKKKEEQERITNEQAKALEDALKRFWNFRFNAITRMPEFRRKRDTEFIQMDDYSLNSITRKLRNEKVAGANKARIAEIIESSFSPLINPIEQYFQKVQPDGKDHIKALCATVSPLEGQVEMFEKFFTKWAVGAVANVFTKRRCVNHLCFILTGQQGAFKSTWIRQLCPPALINYYFEGNLDPENKDDLFATSANFIYNLDDYFAEVTKKKINSLKSFITKDTVNARRAYGRYPEELPKICSFIASSNDDTFLHDPTGNRRFVPFEVTAIDIEAAKKIDIDQVWAQAYSLFRQGHMYWLSKEDQKELKAHNSKYEVQSLEFELVNTYFQQPTSRNEADVYLTVADIINRLSLKSSIRLTAKKVGEALKKGGFIRFQKRLEGRRNPTWVYALDLVEEADLEEEKTTRGES